MIGVVYQPFSKELFSAVKGQGAFLNETKKLSVTKAASIRNAMVVTGFYYDYGPNTAQGLKAIELLIKNESHGIRCYGAASLDLCFVAAGRFDVYYLKSTQSDI